MAHLMKLQSPGESVQSTDFSRQDLVSERSRLKSVF